MLCYGRIMIGFLGDVAFATIWGIFFNMGFFAFHD
jgi:hypothetical protein